MTKDSRRARLLTAALITVPDHVRRSLEDRARRFVCMGNEKALKKPGYAPVLDQESAMLTRLLSEVWAEGYGAGRRDDEWKEEKT